MTDDEWRGGLAPHYDYMLPGKPDDPAMRESASIWLFEENGEFALPRVGIEGIGASWENHRVDMNSAFPGGRVLVEVGGGGETHSPIGADGKPSILGSGGLRFECVEPYKRWRVTYAGNPVEATAADMLANTVDPARRAPLSYEVDVTMVTPCWVQDNTPEKLVGLSMREMDDARSMGLGYRMEHLFRAEGTLTVDGKSRGFTGTGLRIHRQSVRPLDGFRGHCWQSAVFPDGRAFGYIAYPPAEDGSTYNEGYVYRDGRRYPAVATKIPWLTELGAEGQDTSLELQSELGTTRIDAVSCLSTFKIMSEGEMAGFALQQGGSKYSWEGQSAYGMIERSTWLNQVKS